MKHTKILLVTLLLGLMISTAGCTNQTAQTNPEDQQNTSENAATGSESSEEAETEAAPGTQSESEEIHDDLEAFNDFSNTLAKSVGIKNLYYEYELRVEGVSREYYSAWKSDDQVRIDTFDHKHSIYANLKDQSAFVLDRTSGILSPSDYDETFFSGMMSPVAFNEALEQDMFEHVHYEGSALMDGKPCDVYEVHTADLNVTYYLWKDNGLTVKMIAQITGFPKYEYYFRSLQPEGASVEDLTPPNDVTSAKETVILPTLKVGQ
ncbi:MAG: hypothetical protein GT601_04120 [Acidaminobacter sp.]|uniref:hypothetical protein n=1 Tax=Acidaminobacter sp. TaxID=1872102 RepID=UPI00137C8A89|nr:hypothetical protein [Acidaminobacter sp.]MZQ96844.1 hypothetical protein [Acidaminobacter sp.]